MMLPFPCSSITAPKSRQVRNVPVRFTEMIESHNSCGNDSALASVKPLGLNWWLLISTSTRPKRDSTASRSAATWLAWETSHSNGADGSPNDLARSAGLAAAMSEEHTSELQSRPHLVCRL